MADPPKDKDLDETKRVMERLVRTPPNPKDGKKKEKPKDSRTQKRATGKQSTAQQKRK